jgi:hypothetical protein
MALMLSKTYDALLAAGAPEEKARDAAEEIAGYENRLVKIETELAAIRETMATRTWVLSVMLLQTVAILGGIAGLLRWVH